MVSIAVCDDEAFYFDFVYELIINTCSDKGIKLFSYTNKNDFNAVFSRNRSFFDIIILDICMPDMNGIDFAAYIRKYNTHCRIIFLTNYVDYSTDIFESEPTSFVLKERAAELLPKAIDRAINQLENIVSCPIVINKSGGGTVIIDANDILYCERILSETIIRTGQKEISSSDDLHDMEKLLRVYPSIHRCHRSYLINFKYVKEWIPSGVIMTDRANIPISRTYANRIGNKFSLYIDEQNARKKNAEDKKNEKARNPIRRVARYFEESCVGTTGCETDE